MSVELPEIQSNVLTEHNQPTSGALKRPVSGWLR